MTRRFTGFLWLSHAAAQSTKSPRTSKRMFLIFIHFALHEKSICERIAKFGNRGANPICSTILTHLYPPTRLQFNSPPLCLPRIKPKLFLVEPTVWVAMPLQGDGEGPRSLHALSGRWVVACTAQRRLRTCGGRSRTGGTPTQHGWRGSVTGLPTRAFLPTPQFNPSRSLSGEGG